MEWFNDHKYNNTLVLVQVESTKAIYIFLQIVLGASKNKLPKGSGAQTVAHGPHVARKAIFIGKKT